MEPVKFFLLICLVSFGAYSEYKAGQVVKKLKMQDKKSGVFKRVANEDEEFPDRVREPGHIVNDQLFGTVDGKGQIEKVIYCISAEEVTSFETNLKVEDIFTQLSIVRHDRSKPEIAILPDEAAKSIERGREVSEE